MRRPPVVDASELLIAGLALVEEYVGSAGPMDLTTAVNIRNGLMVALLASCPIRARNLAGLTLGRSLHLTHSCWWIDLPGSETKGGRPDCRMVPEFLRRTLETYLREARPFLLSDNGLRNSAHAVLPRQNGPEDELSDDHVNIGFPCQNDAASAAAIPGAPRPDDEPPLGELSGPLWASRYGVRMTYSSIHHAVPSVTEATIGVAIAPHGFRRAAATTAAWKAGAMPNLAAAILQHMDRRTTEASYIRATSFEAAQRLGTLLRRR